MLSRANNAVARQPKHSMFEAPKPPKAPRKSVRSTSPRAVELRRLQNRLSQRKHRLRLRQARENARSNSSTVVELQAVTAAGEPPNPPQHALVDTNTSSVDMVHLMADQNRASPLVANTMIMADELLQYDTPWHHIDSIMGIRATPETDTCVSPSIFTPSNVSPPSTASTVCTCNNLAGPCPSHVEKMRAQILAEARKLQDSDTLIVDDTTSRFSVVLEAIREAGYQDMEDMVLAFYTSRFERGSIPAMVQCNSRKRRLKSMLQDLQKSSESWPRWESRGLHESISEAAICLCVEELERLNNSLPALAHPPQTETANLVSALEWQLRDQGCGATNYLKPQDGDKLERLLADAPDSMPHLWFLLTELTGSQGLYCDRLASIVLAVILHARRAQ